MRTFTITFILFTIGMWVHVANTYTPTSTSPEPATTPTLEETA